MSHLHRFQRAIAGGLLVLAALPSFAQTATPAPAPAPVAAPAK